MRAVVILIAAAACLGSGCIGRGPATGPLASDAPSAFRERLDYLVIGPAAYLERVGDLLELRREQGLRVGSLSGVGPGARAQPRLLRRMAHM